MASFNSIYEQVKNLHKDWSPEVVEVLAEDLYQDALEREAEYYNDDDYDYDDGCEDW